MATDLKNTIQLPKTDFAMRANLVKREPERIAHWEKLDLYAAIQKKRAGAPAFVLHDGPPFTNGDVHIGTALNKVLKDIVNRYKSMRGFRTPFVPGWDCHGLPIEQKVTAQLRAENKTVSTAEMRALCGEFSEKWIAHQTKQFKRVGVLADWASEYKTKAPAFEADIIRTFAAFVEKGLVYRSKKPVYWSIPFETALAEAEIEYKDHVSPAIWVKFPVPTGEAHKYDLPADKPLSVVIWTTTPWTIPANLAIAVNPDVEYVVADLGEERIVVAELLLPSVLAAAKIETAPVIDKKLTGAALEKLAPRHPFIDRAAPVVLADYVTTDSGTGCVHTAPGHGAEDYLTGLKYSLPIYCPVADDGKYIDDGQIPADLVGLTTLETVEDLAAKRTSPANIAVLKKLDASGALLAKAKYTHSYPHCWRSKTPIIFRAVDQWFVSLDNKAGSSDGKSPRETALAAIANDVAWVPASGEKRITGAVESRPDWCISRQRSWGVPIIAFYDDKKNPYLDANVIRAVAEKIEKHGTNYWYDATPAQILEGVALPATWPAADALACGRDTLDVWIDSGSSHAAVLKRGQGGTQWPADLYLEGSDQHRGWFQSSLWTSVAAYGAAPYKRVLTHGFIVGADGKKISKSGQYEKPPTSDNYIAQYGADVIRLLFASQNFTEDLRVSNLDTDLKNPASILNVVAEAYRLFRNTFRYQLSNLFDYDHARDAVPYSKMDTLDRWALHQAAALIRECTAAYDAYEFHRVYQLCNQFCSVTLSAVYHDILKDRLYTHATNSPQRRSSQTAIHEIFHTLAKLLAPVLAFTTDEAWSFATAKTEYIDGDSIHLRDWPVAPAEWTDATLETDIAALLKTRAAVTEAIEPLRAAGKIGKSLDAVITLNAAAGAPERALYEKHRDFLPELFIVSQVEIADAPGAPAIEVSLASERGLHRCPRCWRSVPALHATPHGDVCPRCAEALQAFQVDK
ncbi:isoleucyl-tRNA synthetase [Ereboglobus sp. PH5-5]|uniref:isoleucine--tRNA ligase n=1 Tax=Ereboglobus sp. PH5-5 TaxID=2940529 RepID=UPI0024056DD9|nr:isoleucine--tRNA ligase [Ereboglobus sp. PH5-5]MDF9834167.1 isoleucyl-tRNA synthetase [Ereboglobus sp. PH5-5]